MPVNLAGGRGTRIPDLRLLLAVHAARQATGTTVRIVREGGLSHVTNDEPVRMTLIFAGAGACPTMRLRATGSFNVKVATHMIMGHDGEGRIHR